MPDRFVLGVNARFAPSRSGDETRAAIEALVAGEGTVEFLDEAPAASPNLDNATLRAFLAATGVEVHPKQAWTDVATLQAHGIPAVNYGPGEPTQAHQPGEWVDGAAVARVAGGADRVPRAGLTGDRSATLGRMRLAKWQALGNHFLLVERDMFPLAA